MVLTKDELIRALRHEVKILLHLAAKIDPGMLEYRPTRSQRSTLQLLQYLAIMGPTQLDCIEANTFNHAGLVAAWSDAEHKSHAMSFEQAVDAIRAQAAEYERRIAGWTDADFRREVDMFGHPQSRGALVISLIVNGHAAYRTQLFCYLKSNGHDELGTMDLWAGVDPPKR